MKVINHIREIRLKREITQVKMAEDLQVTRQTINAIEKKYNPSLELALKIIKYFDLPIDEIFILKENENEWEKWGNDLTKWVPYNIIACTFIGALLGSFLIDYFQGDFPYEVLIAGLVSSITLTIIQVIKQKRKKDNLPEADERTIHNIFRLFAYASHITLVLIFVSLGVFTLLGNESISIFYLWILFFSYIWIVGIGTIVFFRR